MQSILKKAWFIFGFLVLVVQAEGQPQSLLSEPVLNWYEQLYAFEPVTIEDSIIQKASTVEKDFARLNYYWQQLLLHGQLNEAENRLKSLADKYALSKEKMKSATPLQVFMAATTKAFEARAYGATTQKISGVKAYTEASLYLDYMRLKQDQYVEFSLLVNIYDACLTQMEGELLYWALLWLMPSAENKDAPKRLQKLFNHPNAFARTEAIYFIYKIAKSLENKTPKALQHLDILKEMYPSNLLLQLEYYRTAGANKRPAKTELEKSINENSSLKPEAKAHLKKVLNETEDPA